MPLIRKLLRVGTSRAVSIPPDWLKYYEQKFGHPVDEILMELNDAITIKAREKKRKRKR